MATPILHHSRLRTARDAGLRAPWWREYEKPHLPFRVVTGDGVELRGVHLRDGFSTLVIYCHGFLSGKNYLPIQRWAELLAEQLDVIAFDFRGHGASGGASTFGAKELWDLDAVLDYAARFDYERIILMGSSMGGAIVLRYASEAELVDGVITLGAFAHKRLSLAAMTGLSVLRWSTSRKVVRWSHATRIEQAHPPYSPRDFVANISPRPLLLIHGQLDSLVPVGHAHELYAQAQAPKQLYVIPRSGHDVEHLSARTGDYVVKWIEGLGAGGR